MSALRFHDLTTQMPFEVWLALDRKARRPVVSDLPVRIVRFSGAALDSAVEEHIVEGVPVRVFSPEKTVADCFKSRHKYGLDAGDGGPARLPEKTQGLGGRDLAQCEDLPGRKCDEALPGGDGVMPSNLPASIHDRLLNLQRSAGVEFNLLLTRYAIERLLYRMVGRGFGDRLVLKVPHFSAAARRTFQPAFTRPAYCLGLAAPLSRKPRLCAVLTCKVGNISTFHAVFSRIRQRNSMEWTRRRFVT